MVVRATVKARTGVDPIQLRSRIIQSLDHFFDPLVGGTEGSGWTLGRDVYRSEVLQTIDETSGVDHVLFLQLIADARPPQCANICLGRMALTQSGAHEVEVV
jgi:hypothetical protein